MQPQHEAIARYVHAMLVDGDWLNDWLTYVPAMYQPIVRVFGQILAIVTGA